MIAKFISLCILVQLISSINCACTQEDFDKADESFLFVTFFGSNKSIYPNDEASIIKQCNALAVEQEKLKQFARKCLNAFSKQTMGLLLRGINKEIKNYCSKEQRANFVNYGKCGQATRKDNKGCMSQFVKELKQTLNSDKDSKLTLVCCSTYTFQDCIKRNMSNNKICTKNGVDAYFKMVKGYTEETKALICQVESGSNECVEAVKQFKKLQIVPIKAKSVLIPFLEITRTL